MVVGQRDSVSLDSEHPPFGYGQGRIALPTAVNQGSKVLFGISLLDGLSFSMATGDTVKSAGCILPHPLVKFLNLLSAVPVDATRDWGTVRFLKAPLGKQLMLNTECTYGYCDSRRSRCGIGSL